MLHAAGVGHMNRLSLVIALGIVSFFPLERIRGATLLLSHEGAADPTTEGWVRTPATTTLTGSAYTETIDDVAVPSWRIEDPGASSGGTNLYYYATMTGTKTTEMLASGFELSGTIKVPSTDPSENVAWSLGSNTWLGYLVANDGMNIRRAWALIFGRSATGQTLVATFQNGGQTVNSRTLDSGYHDYSIIYNPETRLSTVLVDGEVWVTDYTGNNLGASAGNNQVYWGDNNGQSSSQPSRAAYYESVQFSQLDSVPEPGRALLLASALAACLMQRRRYCWNNGRAGASSARGDA